MISDCPGWLRYALVAVPMACWWWYGSYGRLLACLDGPGVERCRGCVMFDADGDGDIDLADVASYANRLTRGCF